MVPKVNEAFLVLREVAENQVLPVHLVYLAPQDLKERVVHVAQEAVQDLEDSKVLLVMQDVQEKVDHKVRPVHQA